MKYYCYISKIDLICLNQTTCLLFTKEIFKNNLSKKRKKNTSCHLLLYRFDFIQIQVKLICSLEFRITSNLQL